MTPSDRDPCDELGRNVVSDGSDGGPKLALVLIRWVRTGHFAVRLEKTTISGIRRWVDMPPNLIGDLEIAAKQLRSLVVHHGAEVPRRAPRRAAPQPKG